MGAKIRNILPFFLIFFLGVGQCASLLEDDSKKIESIFKILFPGERSFDDKKINDLAQRFLLRPKGEERLSVNTFVYYSDFLTRLGAEKTAKTDLLFGEFASLGMLSEVLPDNSFKSPKHICILGSSISNMRERLDFVIGLVKKGDLEVSLANVWFVVGDREALPQETKDVILNTAPFEKNPDWVFDGNLPSNEKEMAYLLVEQMNIPDSIKSKIKIFSSPKIEGAKRSTTETTLRDFFASNNFDGGKVLLISSNPFASYQLAVAKRVILGVAKEKGFSLNDISVAASAPYWGAKIFAQDQLNDKDKTLALGVLLDNLARLIYEKQIAKNK